MLTSFAKFVLAGAILGAALWFAARFAAVYLAQLSTFRDETTLALLVVLGAVVYAAAILPLFGRRWLISLVR
jgi:putative peptidoglycan lipid II flippase